MSPGRAEVLPARVQMSRRMDAREAEAPAPGKGDLPLSWPLGLSRPKGSPRGALCMEGLGHGGRKEPAGGGAFLCSRFRCSGGGVGCATAGTHLPSLGTCLLFGKMTIVRAIPEGWVRWHVHCAGRWDLTQASAASGLGGVWSPGPLYVCVCGERGDPNGSVAAAQGLMHPPPPLEAAGAEPAASAGLTQTHGDLPALDPTAPEAPPSLGMPGQQLLKDAMVHCPHFADEKN